MTEDRPQAKTDTDTVHEVDLRTAIDGWREQMAANHDAYVALVLEHGPHLYRTESAWQRLDVLVNERRELRRNIAEATQEIHMLRRQATQREANRV